LTGDILVDLQGFRVYLVTGNTYAFYFVEDPDGARIVKTLGSITASLTGWKEFTVSGGLITTGYEFEVIAQVQEPDPTPTVFTGNWTYDTPNNPGVPTSGVISHANNESGVLRVNKTDNDSGDRSVDLASLDIGDVIQFNQPDGTRYAIQSIADNGTWIAFGVAPSVQSAPDGVTSFGFETVTATPITIMQDTDYWTLNPRPSAIIQGTLAVDDNPAVLSDEAYGVDILVQEYTASPDWDMLATSVSASGGEGGGGTNPLPPGGATDQALTKIDGQDYNVEWSGPYLALTGGTMLGPIDMSEQNLEGVINIVGGASSGIAIRPAATRSFSLYDGNGTTRLLVHTGAATLLYDQAGFQLVRLSAGVVDIYGPLNMQAQKIGSVLDPVDPQDAATKAYVDTSSPPQTYLHDDLTDVNPDQHHIKYTDVEAVAAVGPHFSGDHADLVNVSPDQHHVKYTDAEAVLAVGPHTPAQTFLHTDLTDITEDQHHVRYTDAEAVSAVGDVGKHTIATTAPASPSLNDVWVNPDEPPEGEYLLLAGGTMAGIINMGGFSIENITHIVGPASTSVNVQAGTDQAIYLRQSDGAIRVAVTADYTSLNDNAGVLFLRVDSPGQSLQAFAPFRAAQGTAALPGLSFYLNGNTGLFLNATDRIGFSAGGVERMVLTTTGLWHPSNYGFRLKADAPGSAAAPDYAFYNRSNLGMYTPAANTIGFSAGGLERMTVSSTAINMYRITTIHTNFYINPISDTSNAGNAYVATDGRFFRSTSTIRNKINVEYVHDLADLELRPVKFTSIASRDNESRHFGFIAEDMPHERMMQRDMYNDIDGYDIQAVVAVLAAKVNRLEAARG